MKQRGTIPFSVENLDRLPHDARLSVNDLTVITGKSRVTIYRWMKKSAIPRPRKIAGTQNSWSAGEIRDWLRNEVQA